MAARPTPPLADRHGALPVSDHCDGARFFNPEMPVRRTGRSRFLRLLRWLGRPRYREPWPKYLSNNGHKPPSGEVGPGTASITFIGHATFLIRLDGLTLLTDPIFSERCSPVSWAGPRRVRPPGQALENLPRPDAVLLSHNHYDHCDLPSLKAIRARFGSVPILAPLGNRAFLGRHGLDAVTELDWWQTTRLGDADIHFTPARHFAARTLFDRNTTLWGGFVIRHGGRSVYFAGDSGYTGYFRAIRERLGAPDLALLPIGAYLPRWLMARVHVDPREAVQTLLDLGARRAVGMHFGTFRLSDEGIDTPLADLARAKSECSLDAERFVTLDFGETRIFPLGAVQPGSDVTS